MRNLISALIIISMIFTFSVQCFAQSALLGLDTMVLLSEDEIVNLPAPVVKSTTGNIRAPYVMGKTSFSTSSFFEEWNAAEKEAPVIKDVSSLVIYR